MRQKDNIKEIEALAKIFNSQDIGDPEIQIQYWGFFQVRSWDNANMRSPSWILYWQPEEKNVLEVDNVTFTPKKDKIYLFPPYTRFSGRSSKPFIQFYIHFTAGDPFSRVKTEMLLIPAEEIIPLILQTARQTERAMQSVMLHSVIARTLSEVPQSAFLPKERLTMDTRIRQAVSLVEKNPGKGYSVRELCEKVKMSPNNFYRKFVSELGIPPQTFLQKARLEYAGNLLLADPERSIEDVAHAAGFQDRYQFSKAFKKILLFPPVTYRKRMIRMNFMSDLPETQMNEFQRKPAISNEPSAEEYFMKEKLNFAKKLLLKSTLSLEEISLASGFSDPGQFSRIFKKNFRMMPGTFRRKSKPKTK